MKQVSNSHYINSNHAISDVPADIKNLAVQPNLQLTPDLASYLLQNQYRTRALSHTNLLGIKRAITAGQWSPNSAAPIYILFEDEAMKMVNGQHRCQAVKDTGITIPVVVQAVDSAEEVDHIDTGKARSSSDTIYMVREDFDQKEAKVAVSALSWNMGYEKLISHPNFYRRAKPLRPVSLNKRNAEARRLGAANDELARSVKYIVDNRGTARDHHLKITPGVAAFLHYRMSLTRPAQANAFWNSLLTTVFTDANDPLSHLYQKLANNRMAGDSAKLNSQKVAICIRVWNAMVTDTVMEQDISKLLTWKETQLFPVLE